MKHDDQQTSQSVFSIDMEKSSLEDVQKELNSGPDGLTSAQAKERLEKYGPNELRDREVSNLEKFLRYFWGPIPWMIEAAAILSAMIGHWPDFGIIMALLVYNAVSGFWQEHKASSALAALKAGMAPKALVLRDGKFTSINASEVVPGDVIRIKLGEVVPADVRFISGDQISIDQAALTGESLPVNKKIGDCGYSGSIAKKGEMTAIAFGTGNNTFFGRTASLSGPLTGIGSWLRHLLWENRSDLWRSLLPPAPNPDRADRHTGHRRRLCNHRRHGNLALPGLTRRSSGFSIDMLVTVNHKFFSSGFLQYLLALETDDRSDEILGWF